MTEDNGKILILISVLIGLIFFTWQVGSKTINSQIASLSYLTETINDFSQKNNFDVPVEIALVVGADLKTIYYTKNIDKKTPIASLTKLISAMVIIDNYDLTDTLVIPREAIGLPETKSIFGAGETMRTFDLLAALLIESSNEAAYTLAYNWPKIEGSLEQKKTYFIEAMNRKAKEIGLLETHFSDPAGLDDDNSLSTAWDVAIMARQALRYQLIQQLTTKETFTAFSIEGRRHTFENSNKLLTVVPNIKLGKTGFTDGAGPSLVLIVNQETKPIILVLLNAQDRFLNAQELLEKLNFE
ncbi:D-alanyl-D-alanine carboxypeptidase [Candidatus Parcubacteria bacterium]|nr:MAG: D-alanyl-D-alanine carboxypeptidase [Candidatus Parcubacteria bacterium]